MRCRRGGRRSFIGDALISPGPCTLLEHQAGRRGRGRVPPKLARVAVLIDRGGAAGPPSVFCGRSLHGRPSSCQLSRLSQPRAVVCSRGLSSTHVALALGDAADAGRAVRDRRLRSPRVGLDAPLPVDLGLNHGRRVLDRISVDEAPSEALAGDLVGADARFFWAC